HHRVSSPASGRRERLLGQPQGGGPSSLQHRVLAVVFAGSRPPTRPRMGPPRRWRGAGHGLCRKLTQTIAPPDFACADRIRSASATPPSADDGVGMALSPRTTTVIETSAPLDRLVAC